MWNVFAHVYCSSDCGLCSFVCLKPVVQSCQASCFYSWDSPGKYLLSRKMPSVPVNNDLSRKLTILTTIMLYVVPEHIPIHTYNNILIV